VISKKLLILCSAGALFGCLPEAANELNRDNYSAGLTGSKVSLAITDHLQVVEETDRGLKRLNANANISGPHLCNEGNFQYSSETNSDAFQITFNNCETDSVLLNGSISGTHTTNILESNNPSSIFTFTSSDLTAEGPLGNRITFQSLDFYAKISSQYVEFSHDGVYEIDGLAFNGSISSDTRELNKHWFDNQLCEGEQRYIGDRGNWITVDRNGAGIDVYFNNNIIQSYYCNWQKVSN